MFTVLIIISLFTARLVETNYQLADYLPKNSTSTIALEKMKEEFVKSPPNARIMIKNVTIPEALEYKQKFASVEGVSEVLWLDDAADIKTPAEMMDLNTLESWYKNGCALFSLVIDEEKIETALPALKEIAGNDSAMTGTAVDINYVQNATKTDISKIMFFIILLLLIILFLTTSSWFEPVLFLTAIGAAIAINAGTNVFLGEISFITKTTASILQLAVSMDYSIFLLHRFAEFRNEGLEVKEAMTLAMSKSFTSILSSGLTTMIGFFTLIFMRFRLGPDLGITLAKSIIFSLVSVIFLLPVLTILTYKIIDKTHHKLFLPSFNNLAEFVLKIKIPIMITAAVVLIPALLACNNNSFLYGTSFIKQDAGSKEYNNIQQMETLFGKMNQMVLLAPVNLEKTLTGELESMPEITSIVSYSKTVGAMIPKEFLEDDIKDNFLSENYARIIITVNTDGESDQAFAAVDKIKDSVNNYTKDYHLTGGSVNVYDMKEVITADNTIVNLVSIIGIGLVVLLLRQSLSVPIILLIVIELSVWINLSVPYFMGQSMAYIGYVIISSVQLGATVDYAIMLSNRYIENRETHTLSKKEALLKTSSETAISILTSSLILASAGFILYFVSSNAVIGEFGLLLGRGALLSAFMVIFLLPALLYYLDGIIAHTTLGVKFYGKKEIKNKNEKN